MNFNREEIARCREEHQKQADLLKEALATNDGSLILKRVKERLEWEETSPYSEKNFKLIEKADELAKELYGKPFSEMSPDDFDLKKEKN